MKTFNSKEKRRNTPYHAQLTLLKGKIMCKGNDVGCVVRCKWMGTVGVRREAKESSERIGPHVGSMSSRERARQLFLFYLSLPLNHSLPKYVLGGDDLVEAPPKFRDQLLKTRDMVLFRYGTTGCHEVIQKVALLLPRSVMLHCVSFLKCTFPTLGRGEERAHSSVPRGLEYEIHRPR